MAEMVDGLKKVMATFATPENHTPDVILENIYDRYKKLFKKGGEHLTPSEIDTIRGTLQHHTDIFEWGDGECRCDGDIVIGTRPIFSRLIRPKVPPSLRLESRSAFHNLGCVIVDGTLDSGPSAPHLFVESMYH